jgi:hypothetical protein
MCGLIPLREDLIPCFLIAFLTLCALEIVIGMLLSKCENFQTRHP